MSSKSRTVEAPVAPETLSEADEAAITEIQGALSKPPEPVAFTPGDAFKRTLDLLSAIRLGETFSTVPGELEGLIAALEKAAPPPPTHEDSCATIVFERVLQNILDKNVPGMSRELAESCVGTMPRDCNCKVSRRRTGSTSTGSRAAPTRLVPVGTAAVQYKRLDGTVEGMSLAQAATQAAADYPGAERCHAYVKGRAAKQSLNARLFLSADVDKKRIPEGIVTFVGDPS